MRKGLHVAIIMDGNGRWATRRDCLVWQDIVPALPLCGGLSSMRLLSASGG